MVAVIREQLQLPHEATACSVLSEGERQCFHCDPPAGTLMERAARLVEAIGVEVYGFAADN